MDSNTARNQAGLDSQNPALASLQVLIGNWEMRLSNAAFLPNQSEIVVGHVLFEWLLGGAFLLMRMGDKPADAADALWLIGRDESRSDYRVLYYDSRRVSRIYDMIFSDGVWSMRRESPGFWQRFEGKFSSDARSIEGHWEKSNNGTNWEHDFDVTYVKKG